MSSGPLAASGADHARRQVRSRLRPAELAVERDLVLVARTPARVLEADQRVVVAVDPEGRLAAAEDLDLAGLVGLDPDRGLGFGDVAQQRPEDQLTHPRLLAVALELLLALLSPCARSAPPLRPLAWLAPLPARPRRGPHGPARGGGKGRRAGPRLGPRRSLWCARAERPPGSGAPRTTTTATTMITISTVDMWLL